MGYHGLFGREVLDRTGIPAGVFHPAGIEFFGSVNFLKGGLIFSDYLTTVSRKYAQEIQTREYGYGLDGVVRGRADRLVGILNGVDYTLWSPEKDKFIAAKYSAKDLSGKQLCKQALMELFDLPSEYSAKPIIASCHVSPIKKDSTSSRTRARTHARRFAAGRVRHWRAQI